MNEDKLTTVRRMRLVLILSRRFARSTETARTSVIVVVAAAFVACMYIVLNALTLSPSQAIERDLGKFGAFVGFGTTAVPPGEDRLTTKLRDAAINAGARNVMVSLISVNVPLAQRSADDLTLQEAPWSGRPFPERYELQLGAWPNSPGEVVVANGEVLDARVGQRLPILDGKTTLRVVGVAEDAYARSASLLAAPGTWARLDAKAARGFALLQAQPVLYWSGNEAEQVIEAFEEVLAGLDHGENSATFDDLVRQSFKTRADVAAAREHSWISQAPAGYTIPSVFLPLLAVAMMFGLATRRFRNRISLLGSLGIPAGQITVSLAFASLLWALTAVITGFAVGAGLGIAARELLSLIVDQPVGPMPNLVGPVIRFLGITVLAVVGAALLLHGTTNPRRSSREHELPRSNRLVRDSRHIAALIVGCVALFLIVRMDSPPDAMILAGTFSLMILLLTPDLVQLVLNRLPEIGPKSRLARRQLVADRSRASVTVALLSLILGSSLGFIALLDTMIRTAGDAAYPEVLPGQVLVADRGSTVVPAPVSVLRAALQHPDLRGKAPIRIRYLFQFDNDDPAKEVRTTMQGDDGIIMALDTPEQVSQLTSRRLSSSQANLLRAGGLLVWDDLQTRPRAAVPLTVKAGDRTVSRTGALAVAQLAVPKVGWRAVTSGVMLTKTAEALNVPISEGAVAFTGVSDKAAASVQQSVMESGQDRHQIQIYEPVPPPIPPTALSATAVGLAGLALVASVVTARSQVRALRGHLGALLAIGISPNWARQVVSYQQGIIVGVSIVLGLMIAAVPVVLAASLISGFTLSIPWSQVTILLSSVIAAIVGSLWVATRRLRPISRHA